VGALVLSQETLAVEGLIAAFMLTLEKHFLNLLSFILELISANLNLD
jgi:hypothetical protein